MRMALLQPKLILPRMRTRAESARPTANQEREASREENPITGLVPMYLRRNKDRRDPSILPIKMIDVAHDTKFGVSQCSKDN